MRMKKTTSPFSNSEEVTQEIISMNLGELIKCLIIFFYKIRGLEHEPQVPSPKSMSHPLAFRPVGLSGPSDNASLAIPKLSSLPP